MVLEAYYSRKGDNRILFIAQTLLKKMIIGIAGPLCTGKSLLSELLLEKGFLRLSFAEELREEMRRQNLIIDRKGLQDYGNEMRRLRGTDYWAKRLIAKLDPRKNYVVEGFRNPGEVHVFQSTGNFVLIGLTASTELRMHWMLTRNKDLDPKTKEDLEAIDARDRGIGEPSYGQQSEACYALADQAIVNDGTIEALREKVETLIEELGC